MLKKAVITEIVPVRRKCKCGATVILSPIENKTYCDICGECVNEDAKIAPGNSTSESANSR